MKNLKDISITKIFFLSAFLLFINNLQAQPVKEIFSEKEYRAYLISEIQKNNDTLQNRLRSAGTIYIRFKLTKEAITDSILVSTQQPAILVEIVKKALTGVKITFESNVDIDADTYFIQPLKYNYTPELTPDMTHLQMLMQSVEDIDVANWQSYLNFDYNGLFNVADENKILWGLKCVFLPPLTVKKHIVYTHTLH